MHASGRSFMFYLRCANAGCRPDCRMQEVQFDAEIVNTDPLFSISRIFVNKITAECGNEIDPIRPFTFVKHSVIASEITIEEIKRMTFFKVVVLISPGIISRFKMHFVSLRHGIIFLAVTRRSILEKLYHKNPQGCTHN